MVDNQKALLYNDSILKLYGFCEKMQNIYIVHLIKRDLPSSFYNLVGVYSSKELADAAGLDACEMYGRINSQHTVTIKALDDIIDGYNN